MSVFHLEKCIEQLLRGEMLNESNLLELCEKVKLQLLEEPNIILIKAPVTVVGDIHGQFYDLLEIFEVGGKIPDTNYLFLGNYVDRGSFSVETFSLLLCFKLRYPHRVVLLRGNHESKPIAEIYGFYTECMRKYGNVKIWKCFTEVFNYLSIAAIIDDKILCLHGGLSQHITSLDQIRVLDRFQDVSESGFLTEILWADPDQEKEGYNPSPRGMGFTFGQDAVQKFFKTNNLEHLVRGHQLSMDGYQTLFNNRVVTIWSAPNFLFRYGNVASILEIGDSRELYFNTFVARPDSKREKPIMDFTKEMPDYFTF